MVFCLKFLHCHHVFVLCRSLEDSISASSGLAALEQWIRYVDWIKTSYPSNAVENGLLEVLERATRSFSDDASMRDNVDYVKLWISYVSSKQCRMRSSVSARVRLSK